MPSQVVARSGEQLRGSLPISTKREVDEVDWEESEEKDVLARLPLDQLLKEMRMALPSEAEAAPALKLLDKNRRSMSSDELTTSSVLVHVYNLNEAFVKANRVLSIAGSGAFHAGVEIFGWEWSYGVRGVKKTIPRVQTRHIYKCSVFLGHSEMNVVGFANLLTESFQDFQGDDYELVGHNCCSFARAMVKKLGVRSMPRWVDRLARGLNLGAFIGAKATKMAAHPVKKAAALGGRVLRMGRGDSESEDSDEDDGLCPTGVEIAEKAKDIPGQIRCGTGAGAQPVAQRARPVAQPVAQVMPRHAPHVQPAMPALPTSMPGFGWQAQAGQQVAMAQVPNVALPRPDQVAAAGYPMPAPVYVAPQTYPAQVMNPPRGPIYR